MMKFVLFVLSLLLAVAICQRDYVYDENPLNIYVTVSNADYFDTTSYIDADNVDSNNGYHMHSQYYTRTPNNFYHFVQSRTENDFEVASTWLSVRSQNGLDIGCNSDNFQTRGKNYGGVSIEVTDVYLFYDVENDSCVILSTNPPDLYDQESRADFVSSVSIMYYASSTSLYVVYTWWFFLLMIITGVVLFCCCTVCVCWFCVSGSDSDDEDDIAVSKLESPKQTELNYIPVLISDNNNPQAPANVVYYPVEIK